MEVGGGGMFGEEIRQLVVLLWSESDGRDLSGGPVAKTVLSMQGARVRSLIRN